MSKKSNSRVPKEFLGAFRVGHRRQDRELIDDDLSHSLLKKYQETGCLESKNALEFITKFNNEMLKGVLASKATVAAGDSMDLHNTPELRKAVQDSRNAKNRDVSFREADYLQSFENLEAELIDKEDEN